RTETLCLVRWCLRDRPKKAGSCQSTFNGVHWHRRHQRFQARVCFEGRCHYTGYFSNDTEAACAFDAKLRAICTDPVRLKKSLNFPTKAEASYEEPLSERRSRGLKKSSQNSAKDVESFQHLQHRFSKSPQASEFEIVNIPSQSRVDALFQPRGSKSVGLPLQLKSSTNRNKNSGECYAFQRTSGYDGMVLVLIALDCDMIWMVPGSEVSQTSLWITLGSKRDKAWRVSQVGLVLAEYFRKGTVPHVPLQDALMQCGDNHIVEEHSHAQLASVLGSVGLRLHRPPNVYYDVVDSVLSWQEHEWRVQEKATHMWSHGRYGANLRKSGGCLGPRAYAQTDFDILIVSLLDVSDRLLGIFLFPSCVLAKRRLVGNNHKSVQLYLYPPWSQPKPPAVAARHSWQLDHFVDLRSWKGKDFHLDPSSMESLTELLDKLLDNPAQAYSPEWPVTHRFPMWKFKDLAELLVEEGLVESFSDFVTPQDPPDEWFTLAHEEEYYRGFVENSLDPVRWRRIGFTQRPDHRALVRRTRLEVAGTLLTARLALETGLACNTAGGTHHAHRAWGSGYTALNDLAVTSKVLLQEGVVSRILICDLDVHQGDGTAEILREDAQAFTLSVHCKDNFPFGFKGMTHLGHDKSDLDVGLAKGTGDEVFLSTISEHLLGALDDFRPDLVLYDAGVDIHVDDDLGNLCISWDGLRKREDLVINACLSKRIPIACVIGGGYDRDPRHLAHRHGAVHRVAHEAWRLSVRLPDGSFVVGDLAVHSSRGTGPHDALQRTWATQQRCRPTPQLPWPQLRKDLSTLALSLLNFGRVDAGLHRRLHDAGERAARSLSRAQARDCCSAMLEPYKVLIRVCC
ncbi:unnamed protein product, partial [Symbiodinium sp. CCMP2456]